MHTVGGESHKIVYKIPYKSPQEIKFDLSTINIKINNFSKILLSTTKSEKEYLKKLKGRAWLAQIVKGSPEIKKLKSDIKELKKTKKDNEVRLFALFIDGAVHAIDRKIEEFELQHSYAKTEAKTRRASLKGLNWLKGINTDHIKKQESEIKQLKKLSKSVLTFKGKVLISKDQSKITALFDKNTFALNSEIKLLLSSTKDELEKEITSYREGQTLEIERNNGVNVKDKWFTEEF
ncbi:MAG: hypothetical protein H0X29_06725 [Parachlamydiaceae bacterium]|nr:hypothetical protein [Parachlamydiaceae bacterium]